MGSPFGGGGGGGNSVTVNIGGNSSTLQAAAQQAANALANFATAATQAGNAAAGGMATATAQMNLLAAAAQNLNAQQQQVSATAQTTGASLDFSVFGRVTGWLFSFNQLVDGARNLKAVLDTLGSTAFGVFNTLSFGVPNALIAGVGMLQQYAGQAMGMLQQYGVPLGPQGIASSFDLNMTTEKTRTGWGYLFGGGGVLRNGQVVDPSGVAQSMMLWSSRESMNLPFTRQDMMTAMTQLGLVPKDRTTGAHLSAAEIEHYLPILSDLAATYGSTAYGGRGVNLQQAAYAVRMSAEGMARMLKMDLNINPEELIHYGLKASGSGYAIHITDPSTLLPALEAFAKAKGVYGASGMMEQGTFSGAWSSFVDRLQNFGLEVGGTDLSGNIRQGSLFGRVKQDLNTISGWMDNKQNAQAIGKLADTIQGALGGGTTIIGTTLGGVFQGMSQSGAGNTLLDDLARFGAFLRDPATIDALRNFGDELGHVVGPVLQTATKAVTGFFSGFGNSGAIQAVEGVLQGLGKWFADPSHQKDIQTFVTDLGQLSGAIVSAAATILTQAGNIFTWLGQQVNNIQNSADNSTLVLGGVEEWVEAAIIHGADDKTLQALASGNPFGNDPTTGKRWDALHQFMFEQAERELLSRQYGDDQAKIDAAYATWLQQEQDLWNHPLKGALPPSGNGGKTGNAGTPGDPRTAAAIANKFGLIGGPAGVARSDNALDAYLSGQDLGASDFTQKGKDAGTAYLAGFQSAMTTSSTPTAAVSAYIAAFDAKIATAGDPLALAIANYVNQNVQIQIANALRNYNGNGDLRQPGGYPRAAGIGPGYR